MIPADHHNNDFIKSRSQVTSPVSHHKDLSKAAQPMVAATSRPKQPPQTFRNINTADHSFRINKTGFKSLTSNTFGLISPKVGNKGVGLETVNVLEHAGQFNEQARKLQEGAHLQRVRQTRFSGPRGLQPQSSQKAGSTLTRPLIPV